jgi:TolA-binding protein
LIGKRTKQLQQENDQLKQTIQQLQKENRRLQQQQQQQQHPTTKMGKGHSSVAVPPPPPPPRLVLERFEGSSFLSKNKDDIEFGDTTTATVSAAARNMDTMEMWCDTPLTLTTTNGNATTHSDPNRYDGTCPLEPDIAFRDALRDRAVWLVSLLILQSISGIILYKNELVLSNHPSSTCFFFPPRQTLYYKIVTMTYFCTSFC